MSPADVEAVYEALAEQLDAIDADRRELFLAKLALLLSHDLGDASRVRRLIAEAASDLEAARPHMS